jgi:Arc/MetJ-type ribon-helix-helix transcriptional regulator
MPNGETKSLHLQLPDKLAHELERVVRAGWFKAEDEVVRLALQEFLYDRRLELIERFQLDDIEWAVRQAGPKS